MLKFRGNRSHKACKCCCPVFREGGRVLPDRRFKTIGTMQPHSELDAERVDPCGIAVKPRRANRVLEEVIVLILVGADASQVNVDPP